MRLPACLVAALMVSMLSGCGGDDDAAEANQAQNIAATMGTKKSTTGTLAATPNPIQVCDGSGLGVTTVQWTVRDPTRVQVRVNAPDGGLFAETEGSGKWDTGKWVRDGTMFYLQDVSGGRQTTVENTIATLTVNITSAGCGS